MKSVLKLHTSVFLLLLLCGGALLFTSRATAQRRGNNIDQQATALLPQADQTVVDRLATLEQLPDGAWKAHEGDIPHGEAVDLDDSSWQTATMGQRFSTDAVWFRQTVEVPATLNGYDLTGARIWFQFNTRGRDQATILYFNGRRVALGDDLEPMVLFDNAHPGDKVVVAVKLLETTGPKMFRGARLRIDFPENRPNPEDMREEFLSAALLLPSLAPGDTSKEDTLHSAIGDVDLAALDAHDQAKFDASLKTASSTLEALKPLLQQSTFYLTGNSHIDAAWLWPWTETVDVVRRTWGTALQLMNEYPNYTYTQSAAQYFDWMQQKYPDMFKQIQERVKQGRFELVGGMWAEPDLNIPDGETVVRNVLYGKLYFQKNFGVDVRIGWNPDTFGYNWQLPQIYKKAGIDYFVTQKMSWNDTNQLPFKLFWWESPDGSKVLAYFPHGYGNSQMDPVRLADNFVQARKDAPGLNSMMDLYGVGDHGGGPTRAMLDEADHWASPTQDDITHVTPKYQFGTAINYFTTIEKEIAPESKTWDYTSIAKGYTPPPAVEGEVSIPTWDSELYLEFHRGVYTTQAKHKWYLRHAPEWLEDAEKYSTLAWLGGLNYPGEQLAQAWETLMFNTNHDLAAGSGIGIIYQDAAKQLETVHWTAEGATQNALTDIDSHINTDAHAGVPILVWNTLSWSRTGIVEATVQMPQAEPNGISVLDADGRPVPMQILSEDDATQTYHLLLEVKGVPSIGYTVLHAVPGKRAVPTDLKVDGTTLENSVLRVVVDPKNGCINSLYDKQTHFETLAAGSCGNILQGYYDMPKQYDAWNINPDYVNHGTDITMADSVQVVEQGPVRSEIRITRHWSKSTFVQNIILYAGLDRVDVVNDVDWHESHIFLKAGFTLAAGGPMATFEIPYGTIERPTTRNNSWEEAKFEVSAQRWADLGDGQHGFSLINDSKYGYDAKGNVLQLSLLRSPKSPDPDADMGEQHFRYSLYPHAGTWREADTVLHGYDFNNPLYAKQVNAHTGELPSTHSFVTIEPENLIVSAMKKSEDGNSLILRFYDWAGKQSTANIHLPEAATSATVANLLEQPQGSPLPVSGDHITVPVGPYSINTVRVDFGNPGAEFWQAQK